MILLCDFNLAVTTIGYLTELSLLLVVFLVSVHQHTRLLHMGHELIVKNQVFTQSVWNPCLHGNDVLSSPWRKSFRQIEHTRSFSRKSCSGSSILLVGSKKTCRIISHVPISLHTHCRCLRTCTCPGHAVCHPSMLQYAHLRRPTCRCPDHALCHPSILQCTLLRWRT